MSMINKKLMNYIENNIYPVYDKNESGHGMVHIKAVTERSIRLANKLDNMNLDMVYVIASYHDIAHHIDKEKHNKLSAEFFIKDKEIKKFFKEEEIKIIKEAIEDHRASSKTEPRSIYGKIIATADRVPDIDETLRKTHSYSLKYYSEMNLDEMIDRAYNELESRYGVNGYSKTYIEDEDFDKFKEAFQELFRDKTKFKNRYLAAIKNI